METERRVAEYCNAIFFNKLCVTAVTIISLCFLLYGTVSDSYVVSLAGVTIFWIFGLLYGIADLYNLYGYAIMQFMLFVFLISRPLLACIYDMDWSYWSDYAIDNALSSIYVCELALFFGSYLFSRPAPGISCSLDMNEDKKKSIRIALAILVIVTSMVEAYVVCRNYLEFRYAGYEAMYTTAVYYPAVIRGLSTVFPLAVYGYLATMPDKWKSVAVLLVYIGMGVPTFLLGNRASLVIRIALATVYFFIRDYSHDENEKKWITRSIKIGFIAFVLFAIAFLGAYNYTRVGTQASDQTYIPVMADFFYRQGTSFDTVCQGFFYEPIIRDISDCVSYSFGGIIDSIKHSTLSQVLFGTSSLGSGNSVNMVVNSNSLAHKLSYVVFGEKFYLEGHGRGSSFILETYYDGGLPYVFVFSFVIGVFLSNLNKLIQKKNWFLNMIVITCMSYIYMIPRSSACSFISFLVTPHFWMLIVFVAFAAKIAAVKMPWLNYK